MLDISKWTKKNGFKLVEKINNMTLNPAYNKYVAEYKGYDIVLYENYETLIFEYRNCGILTRQEISNVLLDSHYLNNKLSAIKWELYQDSVSRISYSTFHNWCKKNKFVKRKKLKNEVMSFGEEYKIVYKDEIISVFFNNIDILFTHTIGTKWYKNKLSNYRISEDNLDIAYAYAVKQINKGVKNE